MLLRSLINHSKLVRLRDAFEDVRYLMLQQNHILPDCHFYDSFTGDLKTTVKPMVRAFKPKIVAEAVEYARLQDESMNVNLTP